MTPDYDTPTSMVRFLVGEIIALASALGGLKEHQRSSEMRHTATEARLTTLETTILRTSCKPAPEPEPWWKQWLPPDTVGKFLVWLAPRLALAATLAWQTIKKVWVAYWAIS